MKTVRNAAQMLVQRKPCSGFLIARPDVRQSSRRRVSRGQGPQQHVARLDRQAAALGCEADGLGESSPDWCDNCNQQDPAAPLPDLDAEWQAFLASSIRVTSPQPLIWGNDSDSSRQASSSSSSTDSSSSATDNISISTSNCGSEASCSNQHSSSIQSFDDWDFLKDCTVTVPCNGSENIHSAAASSHTAINSLDASHDALEWPVAEQLLPTRLSAEVRARMELKITRNPLINLREAYVLLFGVGKKDREGIYSLRSVDDHGLITETIIAFESMDDAFRYATLLEATMNHSPHVCSIPAPELTSFCNESGYICRLELEGSLLRPPDYNVLITDWERGMRLREGQYNVLLEEPEVMGHQDSSSQSVAAGPMYGPSVPQATSCGSSGASYLNHHAREFTESELISLKAQLEALLPE